MQRSVMGFAALLAAGCGRHRYLVQIGDSLIDSLVVHPDYNDTEVGSRLLNTAVKFLQSEGKSIIDVANFKEFRFFFLLLQTYQLP